MKLVEMRGIALATLPLALWPVPEARSAALHPVNNIVLVHGASNDGSAWRGVYDILRKDGYHVSVVQEPLTVCPMTSRRPNGSLTGKTDQ
jgi:hypothetical protein